MDRGAWRATVHGVARVTTWWLNHHQTTTTKGIFDNGGLLQIMSLLLIPVHWYGHIGNFVIKYRSSTFSDFGCQNKNPNLVSYSLLLTITHVHTPIIRINGGSAMLFVAWRCLYLVPPVKFLSCCPARFLPLPWRHMNCLAQRVRYKNIKCVYISE